ncbi:hypothetical protein WJX72_003756 [[Myrmecia] bisecta]|uniref:Uncharacterized protein n=1 Tax=[Myrmecia] bisecta TaxID=41462 RepID=A0AAW1PNN0_9CHLO
MPTPVWRQSLQFDLKAEKGHSGYTGSTLTCYGSETTAVAEACAGHSFSGTPNEVTEAASPWASYPRKKLWLERGVPQT